MADVKKVKSRKIKMSLTKAEEEKLNNELEKSDNFSLGLMLVILVSCFAIGIALGYVLYRIAIFGTI